MRILASKSTAKRTSPPRAVDYAKSFLKDWERLTHSGRYDMRRLKEVMLLESVKPHTLVFTALGTHSELFG